MPPTRRPPGSQLSTDSKDAPFPGSGESLPTQAPARSRSTDAAAGHHHWVDPRALPDSSSKYKVADITGNVPQDVKRLVCNTLASYGIGSGDGDGGTFGVGEALEVTEMHVVPKVRQHHWQRQPESDNDNGGLSLPLPPVGRDSEVIVVCELVVRKSTYDGVYSTCAERAVWRLGRLGVRSNILSLIHPQTGMVNGAGVAHGGCIAYLLDKYAKIFFLFFWFQCFSETMRKLTCFSIYSCASGPLVVLGLLRGINAVGVTQNMHITYHAPAPL